MEQTKSLVRVVVAQPDAADPAADTLRALRQLGPEIRCEVVRDAATCLAASRAGPVDLVVADWALGPGCEEILETLREDGPPVIVVGQELDDEAALSAFRRGAAEVVRPRAGSGEVLAVVAQEQVRRWRAVRERRSAQRRIGDLERYNENIIQNMNSALLVVDTDGRIAFSNPAAEQILDAPHECLHGESVWSWFPRGVGGRSPLTRTLAEGARCKGAESTITRHDGSVVPIGISCAPMHGSDGARLGAVAIFQDLTEVKQLRNQVLQTEKMASIGQLAAGVAHEINNPMGFIHANLFQMAEYASDLRRVFDRVESLQKAIPADAPEPLLQASEALSAAAAEADVEFVLSDLAKAIRECQEGSERIRHIVHDLRDFSHHDASTRVLTDINQCLDSTASIVWPMMKHLVVLEKHYEELPSVFCYPMQLKQVFTNLLLNAYQAIEERLGESGECGRVDLYTERRGDRVVVSVRDTGAGISSEHLDRIFDPFFTTKKVGAGTGLGLSTSYNIMKRHGGSLSVESRVGEGTTFRVSLPIGDEEPANGSG